ncbi:hypothetical protein BDW02DRAFT_324959 [Decorospora gaudefroyi]|uniref:GRF-type domain-containing protein n=1 Tax=Decorospora gaudefroyi TaxID=184978 RepID=A0A6A5KEM3_9PLEO|nr:hypothetical protein BDW02DRAFT_324959 [Decorospora gaudefroyi]
MGWFTKKPKEIHNHYHTTTYQQTTVSPPPKRLPACRKCNSSSRTQLAITQNEGPNHGRGYYVCIGCPAPGSKGRSWIVWADSIVG